MVETIPEDFLLFFSVFICHVKIGSNQQMVSQDRYYFLGVTCLLKS